MIKVFQPITSARLAQRKNSMRLLSVLAFALSSYFCQAQSGPTFQTNTRTTAGYSVGAPPVVTSGSPVINNCSNFFGVAYRDQGTGNLAYSESFNGTGINPAVSGFPVASQATVAITQSSTGCNIIYSTSTGFMYTNYNQGNENFSQPQAIVINSSVGYNFNYRPSLTYFNNKYYLSLTQFNSQLNENTISVYSSSDCINFSNEVIPVNTPAAGGSSLAVFQVNGTGPAYLALAFTQLNKYPVLATSSDGVAWTSTVVNAMEISSDPALAVWAPGKGQPPSGTYANIALYIFGRSTNQAGNLLETGTYDGVHFAQAGQYSITLKGSPSAASFGSGEGTVIDTTIAYQAADGTNDLYLYSTETQNP